MIGEKSEHDIKVFLDWVIKMHNRDQVSLPCGELALNIISMDMTLKDIFRMAGRIPIIRETVKISEKLENDKEGGWKKDDWRKVPVKILVGGPNWCGIVAVDLGTAGKPWIKPVTVQKGILEFIQGLPNCVGVGIREDVKNRGVSLHPD